jgi:hypothetical protein
MEEPMKVLFRDLELNRPEGREYVMPEVFKYSGKPLRVCKRAHKICDKVNSIAA